MSLTSQQSAAPLNSPLIPFTEEAKLRYHGIPTTPRFDGRYSADHLTAPTGMEVFLQPKVLRPVGEHSLCDVWEDTNCRAFE